MTGNDGDCTVEHPVTHGRCQLPAGHAEGHVFPIDDSFMDALDEGMLVIGRASIKKKQEPPQTSESEERSDAQDSSTA